MSTEREMVDARIPRIARIAPGEEAMTLRIHWDDGVENTVDVSDTISTYRVFAPLRGDEELFRRVRVGQFGADVVWTDEIDMSADTLWRLAQEQVAGRMVA